MSQDSLIFPTTGTLSGLDLVQDLNAALANLASNASGSIDPSTLPGGVVPYSLWLDTSVTPPVLRQRSASNNGWGGLPVAPGTQPQDAVQFGQISGVVGSARNLRMYVDTASASATLTADEIIVESALGGLRYCLSSFSKTINLATTGAGGMDTGSAPNNGFVALYAIYNPTTLASALLAVNATAGIVPEVYGGANMPAGYTASALVAVVPTNGSGQIQQCGVLGRTVTRTQGVALSSTSAQGALTSLSLASFVPFNARSTFVQLGMANANNACGFTFSAFPDSVPTGQAVTGLYAGAGYGVNISYEVPIYTAQTIWYQNSASAAGTLAFSVYVFRYTF